MLIMIDRSAKSSANRSSLRSVGRSSITRMLARVSNGLFDEISLWSVRGAAIARRLFHRLYSARQLEMRNESCLLITHSFSAFGEMTIYQFTTVSSSYYRLYQAASAAWFMSFVSFFARMHSDS